MAVSDETIRLILDLGASGANVEKVRSELDKLKTSTDKVGESQTGMGRAALGASYAFQDFTSVLSGGQGFARALSSIQNNIPQVLESLGVGAGLTGVVSVAAVGIGLLLDKLSHMSTEAKTLKQQIEENNKALENYGNQLKATQKDVEEYNKNLAEKIRLQSKEEEQKLKAAGLKEVPIPDEAAKERGQLFVKAVGGHLAAVTQEVGGFMRQQFEEENKETLKQIAELETQIMPEELRTHRREQLERQLTRQPGEIEGDAARLVGLAAEGDARAIAQLARIFPGRRGIAEATEGAQQARIIEEMTAAHKKEDDKAAAAHKRTLQEKRKRMDAVIDDYKKDVIEQAEDQEREDEKAKAKREAARKKWEHEHTPEAMRRRRHEALEEEARGSIPGVARGLGLGGLTESQAESVVGQTMRNLEDYASKQEALVRALLSKYAEVRQATGFMSQQAEFMLAYLSRLDVARRTTGQQIPFQATGGFQ